MNVSIPTSSMEYIEEIKISPLISHVKIKVCYVGQEPNRNGTVITKEVATEMGKNIPGSPIVGYYNKETEDFDSHNRDVKKTEDGKYELIDLTKPYGFVPTDAKVWFQIFKDGEVEHEYLCTEGYIWTEIYKESRGITEHGSNQSMELADNPLEGNWTKDNNTGRKIFIFSDILVEKLCILGQNIEPCFEGAQITSYSFNVEELKNRLLNELKDFIKEGGLEYSMNDKESVKVEKEISPIAETAEETPISNFEAVSEPTPAVEIITPTIDYEVKYNELKTENDSLIEKYNLLKEEVKGLREFKISAERKSKQEMIDSFYMLSDEDKKDVVANIDTYSLDDIEAKLSVICVRNKVSFAEETKQEPETDFSLNLTGLENVDTAPAWVQAVKNFENI